MLARRWPLCRLLLCLLVATCHGQDATFAEGACLFTLQELIKASERTCFDHLPRFLCCHEPPSIGCFRDDKHRDMCCSEAPFSSETLTQDYLLVLVTGFQEVLQRSCPFAAALTQLLPYTMENLDLKIQVLVHEMTPIARAMSHAGAEWSNLLASEWPVFGILNRVREMRLKSPTADPYYASLAKDAALSPVMALAQLNASDCMIRATARLHLALQADFAPSFLKSPAAQLIDDAEGQAVKCVRKLHPRLKELLLGPAPILPLLHRLWQRRRQKGWKDLVQSAQTRDPTSLTQNACLCQLEWTMDLENQSFTCGAENYGCCDAYGTGDFFCPTQPGCHQTHDTCFPRKSKIGGGGLEELLPEQREFLLHRVREEDLRKGGTLKCYQIARAVVAFPTMSQVLDVGAGTAPCKPVMEHAGFNYTAQDAMHYNGTEGIAGSVFLQGYGQIDVVSDIGSIPLPDESFDLVICTDVLEHVLNPKRAMHEMGRLLKPGGMVLLQVPFGGALHNLPHHYFAGFTHKWFEKVASAASLEVAWGYHFETLARRLQRSLQSEECLRLSLHRD